MANRPVILITGIWLNNKGSDLMLHAILQHLRKSFPEVKPVCGFPIDPGAKSWFRSRSLLDFDSPSNVDVILDASGFRFGDQWSDAMVRTAVDHRLSLMNPHTKLILLPQAFGSFERTFVRNCSLKMLRRAAMVCSRDPFSFERVCELCPELESHYLFPDFTGAVEGIVPDDYDIAFEHAVAIIPNDKMIEKRNEREGAHYLNLLRHLVLRLRDMSIPYYFMCHQNSDINIVKAVDGSRDPRPLIRERCPLRIKGALGAARFLFSSRYHGLLNGFNQGVPCIGTSWSHKYAALFTDFGCDRFLLEDVADKKTLDLLVDDILESERKGDMRNEILQRASLMIGQSRDMWNKIDGIILAGMN